jgi:isohexenylglutaconyl-CoA hydratase
MTPLPPVKDVKLGFEAGVLSILFNRPDAKNALSREMVGDISAAVDWACAEPGVRIVVMRGAGGTFCAGGDIKGFRENWQLAEKGDERAIAANNRRYGALLERMVAMPQAIVACVEGAAVGGGFGFASVADVVLATEDARFGMPEAGMGLLPAQIAPFVQRRVGTSQAVRLAVTLARVGGEEALRLGIVHRLVKDGAALEAALGETVAAIKKAAPGAVGETKRLFAACANAPLGSSLDEAAFAFARAMKGAEAQEGVKAFIDKRKPGWAT